MSVAAAPSIAGIYRSSAIVLGVGFALSVMIHLGVGAGASGYFGSVWGSDDGHESSIEMEQESAQLIAPPDELRLGLQESEAASINWLGVINNPEIGDVAIAEVEQAEFTHQIGDAPVTVSPEPIVQPVPAVDPPEPEPIIQEEQVEAIEPEPVITSTEQNELEIEREESAPVVIEFQPEPVEEPAEEPVEELVEEQPEETVETDSPTGPELVSVDPIPPAEAIPAEPQERPQETAPTTAGKVGTLSTKESAASKIKNAIKINAKNLHKPIVGKGLEITTVEPRFPASVRFTELPRNPVVMIRFNALGRVSKVYFLTERRRIFDTGVKGVDEPLISAIYQWRAKGKEIDTLDPGLGPEDPASFVEISMRITFRKETKSP